MRSIACSAVVLTVMLLGGGAAGQPTTSSSGADPALETTAPTLLDTEAFSFVGTGALGHGQSFTGTDAKSIDVSVIAAILKERAEAAAIRTVTEAIEKAAKGEMPLYARELLTKAAEMTGGRSGFTREQVEGLVLICLRALTSEALTRGILGPQLDPKLAETLKLTPSKEVPAALRPTLQSFIYRELALSGLFKGDAKAVDAESVPCAMGRETCAALVKLAKEGRLASTLKLDDAIGGLRIAAALGSAKSGLDVSLLLKNLTATVELGDFTHGGLDLSAWFALANAVDGAIVTGDHELTFLKDALAKVDNAQTPAARSAAALELKAVLARPARPADWARKALALKYGEDPGPLDALLNARMNPPSAPDGGVPAPPDGALERRLGNLPSYSELMQTAAPSATPITDLRKAATDIKDMFATAAPGSAARQFEALPLSRVGELSGRLREASTAMAPVLAFYRNLGITDPKLSIRVLIAMEKIVPRAQAFAELLQRVPPNDLGDSPTIGDTASKLRATSAPLLEALEPIAGEIAQGKKLSREALLKGFLSLPTEQLAAGFGFVGSDASSTCKGEPRGARCWSMTILDALKQAIQPSAGGSVTLDVDKLGQSLVKVGDDFRRTDEGRFYLHLTIGMGLLYSGSPPNFVTLPDGSTQEQPHDTRIVPLVAEQIGAGYAFPSFCDGNLEAKFGLFGSGILYRIVVDSAESKAVMFGGVAALDIQQLIEIYAAPTVLIYPPIDGHGVNPRPGFALGAQVPLGDYLSRITSK